MHYFDYAAATPISDEVVAAMRPYFADKFFNPSAMYLAAQDVKRDIAGARENVADVLQCRPSEVIFTAGGTESDNLAVRGVMDMHPDANCVVSAVEHEAVLSPASRYDKRIAAVKPDGRVDVAGLKKLIDDKTALISVMYANNEIGAVQPLREISQLVKSKLQDRRSRGVKTPLYFHTDAAQAPNYLPLLVNNLGVDLMSLNGGKIYGPKQSGILFVRTGVRLSPQILGGGQERGLRSGTENAAAVAGFAAALRHAAELRTDETARIQELSAEFMSRLLAEHPEAAINGSLEHRLPNNVHVTFPGVDNERLIMELDERGIMAAAGSACSASSDEPSHVLKAVGLTDQEARASLRFTFGRQTGAESIEALLKALRDLLPAANA